MNRVSWLVKVSYSATGNRVTSLKLVSCMFTERNSFVFHLHRMSKIACINLRKSELCSALCQDLTFFNNVEEEY